MPQLPALAQCEGRTASGAQCKRKTAIRPSYCEQHPLALDDPLLRELLGVGPHDPMILHAAPESSDGTDTPLPVYGCGLVTVTRVGGYHRCDECGVLGRQYADISDHVRREHVALPAFGLVAESIRRERAESAS